VRLLVAGTPPASLTVAADAQTSGGLHAPGGAGLQTADAKQLPKWPLRTALSLLLLLEVFFTVMLSVEGVSGNVAMLLNSIALILFSVLTWRGLRWGRWFLLGLVVWRVAEIAVAAASHGAGDHRLGGSLVLAAFYVVVGLLVTSPLGRHVRRAAI
jgi:hypothetical protein